MANNVGVSSSARAVLRHDEERDDQEERCAHHQVYARAEHQVDFAHVVRGARHGVAHRLQVVEGHALAEQGDVELIADVAFDALRHQLRAEVAPELQHAAQDLRAAHDQRQRNEAADNRVGLQHVVEGAAHQHGDGGRQCRIADRAKNQHDQDRPISHGVRPDPTLGAFGALARSCG